MGRARHDGTLLVLFRCVLSKNDDFVLKHDDFVLKHDDFMLTKR